MQGSLRKILVTTWLVSGLTAGQAALAQPRALDNAELDQVTAGVTLDQLSAALATGALYAIAQTNSGGSSTYTPFTGGGFVESGVIGGTASGISDTGSAATVASSSGSVSGYPLVNMTVGGTVAGPAGQASISFTYVTGGTYFLPL